MKYTVTQDIFSEKLCLCLKENGLGELYSDEMAKKFYLLTGHMLSINESMNLTAITDVDDIILKHYVDSLKVSPYINEGASVIDIGCGAGFPSLPLAIARSDVKILALDSTTKRINYIQDTAKLLGITGLSAISARAEELAHDLDYREKFDFATARAVAKLNVLCELCLPYVKVGGRFLSMKANVAEELTEAKNAIVKSGGALEASDLFDIVSNVSRETFPRAIISIKKISHTDKNYPRNNSQIKKKPL